MTAPLIPDAERAAFEAWRSVQPYAGATARQESAFRDGYQAARRELLARQVEEWMPISTAPKDELILVGPTKRMGICAAMNHSRDGWVTETCSEWATIYTPTHWMHLPPPPLPDNSAFSKPDQAPSEDGYTYG